MQHVLTVNTGIGMQIAVKATVETALTKKDVTDLELRPEASMGMNIIIPYHQRK